MRQILITLLLVLLAIELPLFLWILWQFRKLKAKVSEQIPKVFEKFANRPSIPGKSDGDRELLDFLAKAETDQKIPNSIRVDAAGILAQRKILTGLNVIVLVICGLLTLQLYLFNV